jgi:hypothetical protein
MHLKNGAADHLHRKYSVLNFASKAWLVVRTMCGTPKTVRDVTK